MEMQQFSSENRFKHHPVDKIIKGFRHLIHHHMTIIHPLSMGVNMLIPIEGKNNTHPNYIYEMAPGRNSNKTG